MSTAAQRRAARAANRERWGKVRTPQWERDIETKIREAQEKAATLSAIRDNLRQLLAITGDTPETSKLPPVKKPHPSRQASAKKPARVRPHGPLHTCIECGDKYRAKRVIRNPAPGSRGNLFCSYRCRKKWWVAKHNEQKKAARREQNRSKRGVTLIPGDPLRAGQADGVNH